MSTRASWTRSTALDVWVRHYVGRGGPAQRADARTRLLEGGLQDIVARLSEHASRHNLVTRAVEGCRGWFLNEPDDLPYSPADVRMEFCSHALCFRSAELSYPYIDTSLSLRVGERDVGYYRLITLPDGTVDDDYLVFE